MGAGWTYAEALFYRTVVGIVSGMAVRIVRVSLRLLAQ